MMVKSISNERLDKLEKLDLSKRVFNTEAVMYSFDKDKVLKRFYNNEGTVFSNKLFTINELIDKKDVIGIRELVMPDRLVTVDKRVIGYLMPYVKGINFRDVIEDDYFSVSDKLNYLKQIGIILERMKNVRNTTNINDFYLNDLHESNFMLNSDTNSINVVDMDSCKINGNLPFVSKYLSTVGNLVYFSKYEQINQGFLAGGCFKPSENTDLFCYTIMILNYIFGIDVNRLSIHEFYACMEYLYKQGISDDLVSKLCYIYTEVDNINLYEYLEEFKYVVPKCRSYLKGNK